MQQSDILIKTGPIKHTENMLATVRCANGILQGLAWAAMERHEDSE